MTHLPTKPCLYCGNPASVRQNRWERTKFCSQTCQSRYSIPRKTAFNAANARARRPAVIQPATHRLIPLTRGAVVKVDTEDFDYLSQFNWSYTDAGYARRTIKIDGKKTNERLHRVVAARISGKPIPAEVQIDHINGNRLDCRRINLRQATPQQNSRNSSRRNSLGYTGVAKNHKRFLAHISYMKSRVYVGTFDTPQEAAYMRDCYAIALHGDFARLNFTYEEIEPANLSRPVSLTTSGKDSI